MSKNLISLVVLMILTMLIGTACSEAPPILDDSPKNIGEAIEQGDDEAIAEMLDKGANINTVESISGYTPLHKAAEAGNVKAIELLLAKGAPTEVMSTAGITPLLLALSKKQEDAAVALLEGGANPNQPDTNGTSPMAYAQSLGLSKAAAAIQAAGR